MPNAKTPNLIINSDSTHDTRRSAVVYVLTPNGLKAKLMRGTKDGEVTLHIETGVFTSIRVAQPFKLGDVVERASYERPVGR